MFRGQVLMKGRGWGTLQIMAKKSRCKAVCATFLYINVNTIKYLHEIQDGYQDLEKNA